MWKPNEHTTTHNIDHCTHANKINDNANDVFMDLLPIYVYDAIINEYLSQDKAGNNCNLNVHTFFTYLFIMLAHNISIYVC